MPASSKVDVSSSEARHYRALLRDFLRENARPEYKFGHQPRLYRLATEIGQGMDYDDDVVFAAAWLHDLGVFVGHRPEALDKLATWDHVAYVEAKAPGLLGGMGFPMPKVPAVLAAVRTHQPKDEPVTVEATILRDADMLEQLGAIGVLRTAAKTGQDSRFIYFADVRRSLAGSLERLPGLLRLERSRRLAEPRIQILRAFLAALEAEAGAELG